MTYTDNPTPTPPVLVNGTYGHRNWTVAELTAPDSPDRLCSTAHLWALIRKEAFGRGNVFRIGRAVRIRGTALDAYIAANPWLPADADDAAA